MYDTSKEIYVWILGLPRKIQLTLNFYQKNPKTYMHFYDLISKFLMWMLLNKELRDVWRGYIIVSPALSIVTNGLEEIDRAKVDAFTE